MTSVPDRERDDHGAGGDDRRAVGNSAPKAPNSAFSPSATPTPAASPIVELDQADDQRLEQHRPTDLAAARAERPQQGELAGALGDEHRERVEDDERADEQGDAARTPAGRC